MMSHIRKQENEVWYKTLLFGKKGRGKIMGFWESAARAGSYIANDMAKTAHRSSKNT